MTFMSLFFCFFFAARMVDPVVLRPVVLRPVVLGPVVVVVVEEDTDVAAARVTAGTVTARGVTRACVAELGGAEDGTGEGGARTGAPCAVQATPVAATGDTSMRGAGGTVVAGAGPEDGAKVPLPHRGAFCTGDPASVGGVAWSVALRFDMTSGSWYARRHRLVATRGGDALPAGSLAAAAGAFLSPPPLPSPYRTPKGAGEDKAALAAAANDLAGGASPPPSSPQA